MSDHISTLEPWNLTLQKKANHIGDRISAPHLANITIQRVNIFFFSHLELHYTHYLTV